MEQLNFIIKTEEFKSHPFSTFPQFNLDYEYVLLTDGESSSISVDNHTTSKMVRKGRFTKVVRITKAPIQFQLSFKSPTKETTYQFQITITAEVKITNPVQYYSSIGLSNISGFLESRVFNKIRRLTTRYTMFQLLELEEELDNILLNQQYENESSGLVYEIVKFFLEPASDTAETLREVDNMYKASSITGTAQKLSEGMLHKSFENVIMEEVAKNKITQEQAIMKIEEYRRSGFAEKLSLLKQLYENNILTDSDYKSEVHKVIGLIPQKNQELPSGDGLLDEEYGD